MEDEDLRICGECGREVPRSEMSYIYDCHGITYKLLCNECWETLKCEYCTFEATHRTQYYNVCDKHWKMFKHIITRPDYPENVIKYRYLTIASILFGKEMNK